MQDLYAGEATQCTVQFLEATVKSVTEPSTVEELHRQLYLSYIRAEEWKQVQQHAMKLYALTGNQQYACWTSLALNCVASAQATSEATVAPNAVTGGGRGFGLKSVSGPEASSLVLAEGILTRSLDKQKPEERDSEQLGLYVHTLVRQGKAKQALEQVIEGKYAYVATGEEGKDETKAGAGVEKAAKRGGKHCSTFTTIFCVLFRLIRTMSLGCLSEEVQTS
jgi:hypothetical protein